MTLNDFFGGFFIALSICYLLTQLLGGILGLFWSFDKGRRLKVDFNRTYDK